MKSFLLLLFLAFIYHGVSAQTKTANKTVKSKKTGTSRKRGGEVSGKNLSDSERDILASNGKGGRRSKKGKGKKEKVAEVKKPATIMQKPIVKNGKSLTGNISTQQGFRICIYDGPNREMAFKIKQDYTRMDTKHRSYIVYNRPNYKIKIGDFLDRKMATKELKHVIQKFPSAFISPDIVIAKNFEVSRVRKGRQVKNQ
ncbi:MAG TPA: hypothetical protein PLU10_01010 [Chitinophagaceae bacterium]|nr:hypothetical protein [Chitinophagaceae bacterium]